MKKNKLVKYNQKNFLSQLKASKRNLNLQNKVIVFIEPYGATLSLLQRGIERKFNIIILSANKDLRVIPDEIINNVQLAIVVETACDKDILSIINQINSIIHIDTVIPGFEYFVSIANKASHSLGLACLHPDDVLKVRRKDEMRLALKNAGLAIPQYTIINSLESLEEACSSIGFPAVCKPIDAAGSVYVTKVHHPHEAKVAALRILHAKDLLWGHQLSKGLLYEEYIEGKEYSMEGIVSDQKIYFCGVTEKILYDQLEFIEIGHIANCAIDDEKRLALEEYITQVIITLGINHCPFHAEFKINAVGKPILMEIAARLPGDGIGNLIHLSNNINYFDLVYAAYLREEINLPEMTNSHAAIHFFYRPALNKYSRISGLETLQKLSLHEVKLYYQENMPIPSFPKPLKRLGHVILKNNNEEKLRQELIAVDQSITFHP